MQLILACFSHIIFVTLKRELKSFVQWAFHRIMNHRKRIDTLETNSTSNEQRRKKKKNVLNNICQTLSLQRWIIIWISTLFSFCSTVRDGIFVTKTKTQALNQYSARYISGKPSRSILEGRSSFESPYRISPSFWKR